VPRFLRVALVLLLLAVPAVWWALQADSDSPAPASAPVKPPPPPPQVSVEVPEVKEEILEETGEELPLEEPVEDGPGPCVELEVRGNGVPAAGARVLADFASADGSQADEGMWRLGASGRARSWCRPGKYTLVVEVPGFAPAFTKLEVRQGGKDVPLRLEMQAGHTLRGYVLSEVTRQPVAGARLSVQMDDPLGSSLEFPPATTDAQGAFELRNLAEGKYTLEVEAPGHSGTTESEVRVPRQEPLILTLKAKGRLAGQVVDGATDAPVAGAEVWVSEYGTLFEDDTPTRTDAQGRFSFEVEYGHHRLVAKAGEWVGTYTGEIDIEQGGSVEGLVIRLGPTGVVSGRVFALSDQQPQSEARVMVEHVDSGWKYKARTDASGAFRVEQLPTGKYEVTAAAQGFTETKREGLQLEEGQEITVELAVIRAATLEGTVVDALGRPAGHVLVSARLEGDTKEFESRPHGVTNAEGEYTIKKLPPGRYQLEAINLRGGDPVVQELTLGEGATARADFTLTDATGLVEGTVRRVSGGLPQHEVRVVAYADSRRERPSAPVDESGRFSLALRPGTYMIAALYRDVEEPEPGGKSVTIEAGKTVQVELTVPDTVTETSGVVLNSRGVPVPGVDITLSNDELSLLETTDDRGQFTLKSSAKEEGVLVTLTAEVGPEHATLQGVRLGSRNLVVRLIAPASLKGRVTARAGAPVTGFALTVNRGEEAYSVFESRPFVGDTFTVEGLPADSLELMVLTTDGRSGKARVRLQAGSTSEVELHVGTLGRVVGRLVDASGAPFEGWVTLDAEEEKEGRTVYSEEDGRFELIALEPGSHLLEYRLPDGEEEHAGQLPFSLRPGETLNVGDLGPKPRR
jgi:hypothetical protein